MASLVGQRAATRHGLLLFSAPGAVCLVPLPLRIPKGGDPATDLDRKTTSFTLGVLETQAQSHLSHLSPCPQSIAMRHSSSAHAHRRPDAVLGDSRFVAPQHSQPDHRAC
ncbi:hypothetical protein P171DRAFT_435866 [Karstenula rhodostoma CBS 690.94]|uniref:Uncharacterized protein n=1 Tax=Karstenula rhodostoma CBS 690.94 TaxID=1392251 RepID=A0A9P4U7N7_9PLEO|nr:hypothetical protein P171DRAFT_435866 [Karstenula rhodostoma CBS 690.94]